MTPPAEKKPKKNPLVTIPWSSLVNIQSSADFNDPAGRQLDFSVVHGFGELNFQANTFSSFEEAPVYFFQLVGLLWRVLGVTWRPDNNCLKVGALFDHEFTQPEQVDDLVVGADVGVLDGNLGHVRLEEPTEERLVRVTLRIVFNSNLWKKVNELLITY